MSKWKLSNADYEFIKGEVIHIIEKYDIKCIPISGFEIAIKMGMTLIPYSSFPIKKMKSLLKVSKDGFYFEDNGKECIFYNNIHNCYERQNMTILHEIGHCVLDHTGYGEHEEEEANFFAKYAIAPPVLIYKMGAESVEEIYDIFDISYEAAIYAYEYYMTWKKRYMRIGEYTEYENRLLAHYKKCA